MIRCSFGLACALVLPGVVAQVFEIPVKTTQFPGGRIVFPRSEAKSGPDNSLIWEYKPTRWGMYEIALVYPLDTAASESVQIEVAGQKFTKLTGDREASQEFGIFPVSRFYLAKSEPFKIRVSSPSPGSVDSLKAVFLRPAPEGKPIVQGSEEILLRASDATTHSVMMRYEPATNKNCLGYWTNPKDTASWDFEVTKAGTYEIELWQGCGKGQGGSSVVVHIFYPSQSDNSLIPGVILKKTDFMVEDTGHFQNFVPRNLGSVTFPNKGKHVFSVIPQDKKAAAVMDIRQIVLKPGKQQDTPK
jgi:hypothetical protein